MNSLILMLSCSLLFVPAPKNKTIKPSAIFQAIEAGDLTYIARLPANGKWLQFTKKGWTPLLYAINHKETDIALAILAAGADPEQKGNKGWTPILAAARYNNATVATQLIAAGVDLNSRNSSDWTPLMTALNLQNFQVAQMLIDAGADVTLDGPRGLSLMHLAAKIGDLTLVKTLHQKGAKINTAIEAGLTGFNNSLATGNTPLMEAAMYGRTEVVTYLLEHGANPTQINGKNRTALDWAKKYRHDEAEALIRTALTRYGK